MRRVGGDRGNRHFLPVEPLRIELLAVEPERQLEAAAELGRLARQPLGHDRLTEALEDPTESDLGLVDIALHLDERHRQLNRASIRIEQGVVRVLPTLVAHATTGALGVLDEAVLVRVAVEVDPFEGAQDGGEQLDEQILVVEPIHHFDRGDEEERGAVDGSVVGRVRDQLEVGELAVARLVQDFSRLLLARRVDLPSLMLREVAQGSARDFRIEHQGLDGGDQRIAAERGREPGDARHREEAAVELLEQDAQVHLAATQQAAVEKGVVGADPGRIVVPPPIGALQRLQRVVVEITQHRLVLADHRDDVDHERDGVFRVQVEMPAQGAVLVERAWLRLDDDFGAAQEAVLAVVGEGQAPSVDFGRSYRAESLHLVAAHVEHVAKVALDPE